MKLPRLLLAVAGGLLLSGAHAQACAMCMGAPDANTGPALNGAIFLMLGLLGTVFTGIGAVVFGFWRRRHHGPPY